MSYVIEVNGVKVEGETLKEATKLAKKEEKRQAEAEKEREQHQDMAYTLAYAEIGSLSCFMTKRLWFFDRGIFCKSDLGYEVRVTQKTTAIFRTSQYVSTTLAHVNGMVYGARLSGGGEYHWVCFGVHEGVLAVVTYPDNLAQQIESQYQAELSQRIADQHRLAVEKQESAA